MANGRGRHTVRSDAGYTLVEMMTVVSIVAIMSFMAVPAMLRQWERHHVSSSARLVASFLKLGRMKAISGNVPYTTELDLAFLSGGGGKAMRFNQCEGADHTMVIHRDVNGTVSPEDCQKVSQRVVVQPLGSTQNDVVFGANGMARRGIVDPATGVATPGTESQGMSWYLIKKRSGDLCQLLCVNAVGAVRINDMGTDCASPNYGADADTPCPVPN